MQRSLLLFFLFISCNTFSQKKYFQQHVDYTIDVRLNDQSHILHAFEKLNYTNNSPDTLRFIFFHLWPNAYKNDGTAFNEQMVENKQTAFYYSKPDQRGFMDSLKFKVNNEEVSISDYNNLGDVVLLELLSPLLPNQTIEISTPFRVVIPEVFSRLGHHDQAYQISQWFPKPAVYDHKGWHPMPYLDQGEFYSEFGNFTVNISLPSNYVVAATGDLQNESELKFMESRMLKNDSSLLEKLNENPTSESQIKTLTFKQNNVHDFAWFANKQFIVEKSIDTLPNQKQTDCYSFFTPKEAKIYENSTEVTAKTIHYLSEKVGEYPYKQASVVAGYLLAGGGMEYPNVTVMGDVQSKKTLQTYIIHEVGHNWFYGLLGSNEREHPWMDEGINSFYENLINESMDEKELAEKKEKSIQIDGNNFIYPLVAKQNLDQAINIPAAEYTKINYGGIVYAKTASMFKYLQSYLGEPLFERCMKNYYKQWQFKHPYPEDIQAAFEQESGKNLSWFFQDCINSNKKIDFGFKKVSMNKNETLVQIKNRTNFTGPVPVSVYAGDSLLSTQWLEYPYDAKMAFQNVSPSISKIIINHDKTLPEIKLNNNYYFKKALFHKTRIRFKIGSTIGLNRFQDLYVLPAVGYNYYDKVMLGLAIHNIKIPNNKFQFAIATMRSFSTNEIVGTGVIGYSFFPKNLKKVTVAIQGNGFHHASSDLNTPNNTRYAGHIKIAPSISIDFAQKTLRTPKSDNLLLKYYRILNQGIFYQLDPQDSLYKPDVSNYIGQSYVQTKFTHKNTRTFNPFSWEINAIANQHFAKIGLTTNLRIDYHLKNKSFYVRGYLGKFFDFKTDNNIYNLRSQYLNATSTDINDFTYNETYLSRNQQKGALSQQISMQEGGMKIKTNFYANPIGENNNWLGAVNFRTDIPITMPFSLPIKFQLFFDACTFAKANKSNPSGARLVYDAGVQLNLIGDIVVLYVPLLMSKDYKDYGKSIFGKKRFENSLSFALNLSKLNLLKTQDVLGIFGF